MYILHTIQTIQTIHIHVDAIQIHTYTTFYLTFYALLGCIIPTMTARHPIYNCNIIQYDINVVTNLILHNSGTYLHIMIYLYMTIHLKQKNIQINVTNLNIRYNVRKMFSYIFLVTNSFYCNTVQNDSETLESHKTIQTSCTLFQLLRRYSHLQINIFVNLFSSNPIYLLNKRKFYNYIVVFFLQAKTQTYLYHCILIEYLAQTRVKR